MGSTPILTIICSFAFARLNPFALEMSPSSFGRNLDDYTQFCNLKHHRPEDAAWPRKIAGLRPIYQVFAPFDILDEMTTTEFPLTQT